MELYKKYRPAKLEHVIGQSEAVQTLKGMLDKKSVPHAVLFSGTSGVGKTTLARILATSIGASASEVVEMNMAEDRGIDVVRDIQQRLPMRPLIGKFRVYILDEFHQVTKDAGQAFLKMFEDCPEHVYFFCCTSEPTKITKALTTRLTRIDLRPLNKAELIDIQRDIIVRDTGEFLSNLDAGKIADAAAGSARQALVFLEQWLLSGRSQEVLAKITETEEYAPEMIELARMLFRQTTWTEVVSIAKTVPEDQIEAIRWMLLRYAEKAITGKQAPRAFQVIAAMAKPFWDGKRPEFLAKLYTLFK